MCRKETTHSLTPSFDMLQISQVTVQNITLSHSDNLYIYTSYLSKSRAVHYKVWSWLLQHPQHASDADATVMHKA